MPVLQASSCAAAACGQTQGTAGGSRARTRQDSAQVNPLPLYLEQHATQKLYDLKGDRLQAIKK